MKSSFFILLCFFAVQCFSQENAMPPFISFATKYIGQHKDSLAGTFTNASGSLTDVKYKPDAYYYYPADTSLLSCLGERFSFIVVLVDSADRAAIFLLSKIYARQATSAPEGIYEYDPPKIKEVYNRIKEQMNTLLAQQGIEKLDKNEYLERAEISWDDSGFTILVTGNKPRKNKDKRFSGNIDITVAKTKKELP